MLTENRERFVQGLVSGMSQREAYRAAFPNCKASDTVVDVKASQLFAVDKVRIRYEELLKEALKPGEEMAIASAQEILSELTAIGMGTKDYPSYDMFGNEISRKPSMTARLKALELLGKKHGLFSDKVDISGAMPVVICGDEELK